MVERSGNRVVFRPHPSWSCPQCVIQVFGTGSVSVHDPQKVSDDLHRTIEGPWHQSQRGPIFCSLNLKSESPCLDLIIRVIVDIGHTCKQLGHKVGVASEDTTECQGSQLTFEAWSPGSPQTCQTDDFNLELSDHVLPLSGQWR